MWPARADLHPFQLPRSFRSFDYSTISDLVLHVRYTARDAGAGLKQSAEAGLEAAVNSMVASQGAEGSARLVSLRHEFPTEWHRFTTGVKSTGEAAESFAVTKNRFPFVFGKSDITVTKVDLYGVPKEDVSTGDIDALTVTLPGGQASVLMSTGTAIGRLGARTFDASLPVAEKEENSRWSFGVPAENVTEFQESIDDIMMVIHYTI